ncbi:MAG: dephospho-CoA kinase [Candidatus Obscuribacterales bacterium]|nr:dephospho-CoA kinase [Candidatus Obscuribacterales bacterium]
MSDNMTENESKTAYVIGVTGSIGTGKSAVGKLLESMGVAVIDTDHLAAELRDGDGPVRDMIVERFGADIIVDGKVSREKLGLVVFNDPQARKDLEDILHPAIAELKSRRISLAAASGSGVVAVLVPLLFETNSQAQYDEVWTVVANEAVQMSRLRERDKRSDEELLKRIRAQFPQEKKAALSLVVIDNSGELEETRKQVEKALASTKERAAFKAGLKGDDKAPAADAPAHSDSAQAASPAAQPDPEAVARAEARYRDMLRDFSQMAAGDALEKMTGVATTAGKEAASSVSMVVKQRGLGADDGTVQGTEQEREVRVDVRMVVRNKPGQVEPPAPAPAPTTPPSPPANPPAPPVPPVPSGNGGGHHPWYRSGLPVLLGLGFFALLAFLAFLAFLVNRDKPAAPNITVNPPAVTVQAPNITVNPPSVTVQAPNITVTPQVEVGVNFIDGCRRCASPVVKAPVVEQPVKPVEKPSEPVIVRPQPVETSKCGSHSGPADRIAEPPAFALNYIHNEVRWAVSVWTVLQDCNGVVVEGRDKEGRLLVRQYYRTYMAFSGQQTFKYLDDGRVQVDSFDSNNIYTGRSYR